MNDGMLKTHLHGEGWVAHTFTAPDFGDPHSHPYACVSKIIWGGYWEETFGHDGLIGRVHRQPGDEFEIAHDRIHRIVDLPAGVCVTAYKPLSEKVQEPAFFRWENGQMLSRKWFQDEFTPHAG